MLDQQLKTVHISLCYTDGRDVLNNCLSLTHIKSDNPYFNTCICSFSSVLNQWIQHVLLMQVYQKLQQDHQHKQVIEEQDLQSNKTYNNNKK